MSTKKSPLARQKDEHESKEKLVDRLVAVIGQVAKSDEDKDELKARLLAASNKKLLRLHETLGEIKQKFGSLEKLVDSTAEKLGRIKDKPYVEKLRKMTPGSLLDLFRSAEKRGSQEKAA